MVVARPDGVLVIYKKEWWKERFRAPMDHGSDQTVLAAVHQAFLYPAEGGEPRAIPLDLVADYENGDPQLRADLPLLTWTPDGLKAEVCREELDMSMECGDLPGTHIAQVQGRIEDAQFDGDTLVLAIGPDGSRDCRVDLSTLAPHPKVTVHENEDEVPLGPRLKLAHFPGRGSYLLDTHEPDQPLYRLTCGKAPARLASLSVNDDEGWTEIYDIVPTADPANPRVIYSTRARFEEAILRDMKGEIWAKNVGPSERSDVQFLDQEGDRLILSNDWIFRKGPGLKLEMLDVTSGKHSTLSWDHDYAPWPDRP